jgi:RNA polymerase sigma-70 factor (ECF subfamily)
VDDADRHARLEDWFRAYGDRVLAYLLHRTDSDTAQDVLQEVFVIAFRKANVVPEPAIGWLLATARRVLANTHRGARRREQLTVRLTEHSEHSEPSGQVGHTAEDDSSVAVAEALARVSPADREVLTLSAWYELTTDEAAAALGCSRSAYSVRLHRARRRLAERLATAGFPTPSRLTEAVNE